VADTDGFTGSDLAVLCREAAMAPVRALLTSATLHQLDSEGIPELRPVCFDDFAGALVKTRPACAS
jgi:SpoVK/Ycf46/Vps4 family AAA+-type ATPase